MRFLQQLIQQLMHVWLGMSVAGRVGFVFLSAICLATILGVGFWAAQPDYRVLFSDLSAEDAGAITTKLQAQGISFRLGAGGTTISVPSAQLQQVRIDLAVAGLPAGGAKGFELLDESPLGVTPFMQHINYNRAIQAELAKTIMQLDPVAYARVHIVRPEQTPFVRDQKPTTASVVLKLKAGATLDRSVAAGIVALVAGSVEGLAPEGVTLLDTSGRVLSEQHGNESGALASSQLDHRRQVETYLAGKAEEMLAQLLGAGRAIVRVTADINFKRVREKKENIDPESRVVTKEKVTNKKSSSSSAPRGVPGVAGNSAKSSGESGGAAPGMSEEEVESSYEFSRTIQELEPEVGNIERLTIAAMVELPAGAEGDGVPVVTVDEAEEIIKRAVGFKPNRDEIKVSAVKLAAAAMPAGMETEWLTNQRWQNYISIARHSSLGVAALAALLMGRMILKRLQIAAALAAPTNAEPDPRLRLLQQLSAEAQQNPDALARALAALLDEPDERRKAAA